MRRIDTADALRRFRSRGVGLVDPEVERPVRASLEAVRERGDDALRALTARFAGVELDDLRVAPDRIAAAYAELDRDLVAAIERAAARIRRYYERQPAEGFLAVDGDGLLGQLVRPLERVAVYVPAGQAPLFSTLLMTAVPAQVAGVPELAVASPPRAGGGVAPEVLAAAHVLGIDEVYALPGVLAVAAFAYGTASVPRADKFVGPGSAATVAAKRLMFGVIGIESLPGPTETLVLADGSADAEHVVADLLAQAEHDGAQPVLVTWSDTLLEAVESRIEAALADLPTADTARASMDERGWAVRVADLHEGLEVANAYAPEHLCLLLEDPWTAVPHVRHAGGIFVGAHSMEALGDYVAGPSHVMPTGGTARFTSFVNVRDFQKVIPVLAAGPATVARIGPDGARMARAEGLEAHARAIESRLDAAASADRRGRDGDRNDG